jgi:hypothetical protein
MTRKIAIVAVESGVRVVARLYEKEAPKTCEAMWKCLETPMETGAIHAMWVGRELMLPMPLENQRVDPQTIPLENATGYPLAGDLMFCYFPPHVLHQPFNALLQDQPLWDFMIMYGADTIADGSATVWGHISEGLDELAAEAAMIRTEGTRLFRVRRLDEEILPGSTERK